MPSFIDPDPVILAFFTMRQVLYVEVLAFLALLRAVTARGPSQALGLACLVFCLAFAAGKFVPPLIGLYEGPLVAAVGLLRFAGGGMTALLFASALLLLSAVVRGRRFWGIDLLHVLWLGTLVGLWGYSLLA